MRYVVNNDNACHLWAHQSQDHARGNSIFFEGATIYSYGRHSPMAKHVTHQKQKAILLTTRTYGVTTAKHLGMVRQSIPRSVPVFNVPFVDIAERDYIGSATGTHAGNLKDYQSRIDAAAFALNKKRVYSQYCADMLQRVTAEANAYISFFKLRKKFKAPYTDEQIATIVATKEARLVELDATREKRQREQNRKTLVRDFQYCAGNIHLAHQEKLTRYAQRMEHLAESMNKWRNGEHVYLPHDVPTMLRVQGTEVVTSRGARFPITHARLGLALVRRTVASGAAYHRNGHTLHLGPYAIDSIDAAGTVHAGCHVVTLAEIENIAAQLDTVNGENHEA